MTTTAPALSTTVMKFGGTSVRDAEAMRRVVSIVERERANKPVVVTSACAGVTDALLGIAERAGQGANDDALARVAELRARHLDILDELAPPEIDGYRSRLCAMLDELDQLVNGVILLGELTPRMFDAFASYGERLSSVLLCGAFHASGWRSALTDSRRFIVTDDRFMNAKPIMPEIDARASNEMLPMFDEHEVIVAQGFIGSTLDGVTTTIGRGGSDHTGALVGAALRAREIQIWTDVSGILTADPRIVPEAKVAPEVTFTEARELAYFGAKVIHPDTILPAVERKIPVVIKNSMRPDDAGTRILPDGSDVAPGVHSITMKRNVMMLTLAPRRQFDASNPVEHALGLFADHGVTLLAAIVAESRATAIITANEFNDILLTALEATCRVSISRDVALLCLSGESLQSSSDVLSRPFAALKDIPMSFIAAGPSDHIVLIGVADAMAIDALKAAHGSLFA